MENRDVIIVGTGAAGLFCALQLPADRQVLLITKDLVERSDSSLAQGGICVLRDEADYESFFEDTMKAGHYENNRKSVERMIRGSRAVIDDLIHFEVDFEQVNGTLCYTKEGAHSKPRILYHKDITGREMTQKLTKQVKKRANIELRERLTMLDIIVEDNTCRGVVVADEAGIKTAICAKTVVFATGGIGGLYENSTNYRHLTGDAIAVAIRHGIAVGQLHYVQIHPTAFYSEKPGRRFLISESVRGEGAVLLNKDGKRFADELLPRDLLTQEIERQMVKDRRGFVWLSVKHLGEEAIKHRFPNIYQHCLAEGYDLTKENIPVTPAQHYLMGGILVDADSMTSMDHLYAIGETSNNGVHGANRLASNSLLESLVYAKRAAHKIAKDSSETRPLNEIDLQQYGELEAIFKQYRGWILDEMEREKHEQESYYAKTGSR